MKISDHKLDALIRAASDELLEEDVNYAKSLDTSTTQISDKAIRRIRRNIRNYDKEPWWNSISQDGAEKTIDVYDFLDDDPVALSDMHDEINFALEAAEYLATSNSTISFSSINHHEFDPSKKGWIFSIGTYSTKLKCTVTRNGNQYTANIDYYLYDVYDWDRNITNMDNLPVSPRDMWELQYGGLAKGYYSNGIASFTVTWSTGQRIGAGASIS